MLLLAKGGVSREEAPEQIVAVELQPSSRQAH